MPETLALPDGTPVDLPAHVQDGQREFDRAMAADSTAEIPAPPKRAPENDGEPKKPRRGRPPKSERARTSTAASAPSGGKSAPAGKDDYTEDAQALVFAAWTITASIPQTQPYAAVVYGNADALAAALAEGAKHNSTIRQWVSGGGGNTWMLQLASVGVSIGMQSWMVMRDPELREKLRESTKAQFSAELEAQGIKPPEVQADDNQPKQS